MKKLCFVLIRGILPAFLVAYGALLRGMTLKRFFGCSFLKTLQKRQSFLTYQLSKGQLTKIIQSGGFLGALLGKLAGPPMEVAVTLVENVLAAFVTIASTSAINRTIQ